MMLLWLGGTAQEFSYFVHCDVAFSMFSYTIMDWMVICVSILLLLCSSVQASICGSSTPQCGDSNSISSLCLFIGMFLSFLGDRHWVILESIACAKEFHCTILESITRPLENCHTIPEQYRMTFWEMSYDTGKVSHGCLVYVKWPCDKTYSGDQWALFDLTERVQEVIWIPFTDFLNNYVGPFESGMFHIWTLF